MDKQRLNRSDLELKWDGLLSHARQAIRNVAKTEKRSIRSVIRSYIPDVDQSSVYHFLMRGKNDRYTVSYLLKLMPLVQADDLYGIKFVCALNTFISDVNTTVRALITIYSGLDVASRLGIDRRTLSRMCNTGLLTTRSLTKVLHDLDRVVRDIPCDGFKYRTFRKIKNDMEPAFKVGM